MNSSGLDRTAAAQPWLFRLRRTNHGTRRESCIDAAPTMPTRTWACHPTSLPFLATMSKQRGSRKRGLTASQQSLLRRFLADRDVPCPHCEYNLRGLETDRCPECGGPLSYTKARRAAAAARYKSAERHVKRPSIVDVIWVLLDPLFALAWIVFAFVLAGVIAMVLWIVSIVRRLFGRYNSS